MQTPTWVTDPSLTPEQRASAMLNFRFRLAAVYHNPRGSIVMLSEACGFHHHHLQVCIHRGKVSRKAALALESVIGDQSVFAASMVL